MSSGSGANEMPYTDEREDAETAEGKFSATIRVLIADDERTVRAMCAEVVRDLSLEPVEAATTEEALEILDRAPVDVVLTDLRIPELGGIELLRRIRTFYPRTAVLMLTQYGTVETAVEAMRLGAVDYLTKPFHVDDLSKRLQRVVEQIEMREENRVLREQLRTRPGFGGLIGVSPKMQRVYKLIEKVSQHHYPVLILGESGTGKEMVAKSIHYAGARAKGPFVPVDCSALVPTLIESELFGHVKGAFTGANRSKQGLMDSARGGTLFLDEIANLPVDLQAKLLRALQEKEIKPVGSTERVRTDARIIAATNQELEAAIRNGSFRQDLFFRLNVVQIKLPPLRERKRDVALLAYSFLERAAAEAPNGSVSFTISDEAMNRLMAYDWPGNVRELENAIERAVALGSGPVLHTGDLPTNLQHHFSDRLPAASEELLPLEELERRAILRALRETAGDKLAAARMLGIGKTTLYRKLKQYDPSSTQPEE